VGRPRPGTGLGLSKNPLRSWPGETRSTRSNSADPVETRLFFINIFIDVKRHRFDLLKGQNDEDQRCRIGEREKT
jgi:hypothetical protein